MKRSSLLLSAVSLLVGWTSFQASAAQPAGDPVRSLEFGETVEGDLAAGQIDKFSIALQADQSLGVRFEKLGLNVILSVSAPHGAALGRVDWLNDPSITGDLTVVTTVAGDYRLEIRGADPSAPAGRYRLRIDFPRPATDPERIRSRGEGFLAGALTLRERGDAESNRMAAQEFEEALSVFETAGDRSRQADVLTLLGELEWSMGDARAAIAHFRSALPLYRAVGNRGMVAVSLNNIGGSEFDLGEVLQALKDLEEALPVHREVGNKPMEAITLNNIGGIQQDLGELQKALDSYGRSLALRTALRDRRGEALMLSNIGTVYAELGDSSEALDFFDRALPLRRETGDRRGEAQTLGNMARARASLGEHSKAVTLFGEALVLFRSVGDRLGEARTLGSLGSSHEAMGERTRAIEEHKRALEISREIQYREGEAGNLSSLGRIHGKSGRLDEAAESLKQALELHRALGHRAREAGDLYELARIALARGDLPEARRLIDNNIIIVESLRANVASRELRASFLGALQDYYFLSVQVLMRMHRGEPGRGYDALALEACERGRALGLLELLKEGGADIRRGVDPELRQRELSLARLLIANVERRRRVLTGKHSAEQVAEIETEIAALDRQYDQVEAEIRVASPSYAALTRPQPLTSSQIQKLLDEETLLLEYSVGEEQSFVWGVTVSSIEVAELPGRWELEALARSAREELSESRASPGGPKRGVARLSERILTPIAPWLNRKRLLIAADGALQLVPFGALLEPGNKMPLIVSHEIVSLPSASALEALRQQTKDRPPAPQTLAVLADPVFDRADERVRRSGPLSPEPAAPIQSKEVAPESSLTRSIRDLGEGDARLPRLPFTRREANAIERLVSVSERMVALGFEANRAAAVGEKLSRYRYVHFATHGLLDTVHPELSGLVLSLVDRDGRDQDGFLPAMEVFNLRLTADLVVLSACQTALGRDIRGEGLVGLTRAFMYAGAPRVVASLWRVDDAATAELMKRFYEGMLGPKKLRPAAALRKAQLEVRRQKRWEHPYYWAGFVLQGEWR